MGRRAPSTDPPLRILPTGDRVLRLVLRMMTNWGGTASHGQSCSISHRHLLRDAESSTGHTPRLYHRWARDRERGSNAHPPVAYVHVIVPTGRRAPSDASGGRHRILTGPSFITRGRSGDGTRWGNGSWISWNPALRCRWRLTRSPSWSMICSAPHLNARPSTIGRCQWRRRPPSFQRSACDHWM
jgi:hypothetical protein